MGLIQRTATSYRDYQDIWNYVAEHGSVSAADRLLRAFDSKLQMISDFPAIGRARPEIRPRIRSFAVGDYLLFYRPIPGGLELLRILHGSRQVRDLFRLKKNEPGT